MVKLVHFIIPSHSLASEAAPLIINSLPSLKQHDMLPNMGLFGVTSPDHSPHRPLNQFTLKAEGKLQVSFRASFISFLFGWFVCILFPKIEKKVRFLSAISLLSRIFADAPALIMGVFFSLCWVMRKLDVLRAKFFCKVAISVLCVESNFEVFMRNAFRCS